MTAPGLVTGVDEAADDTEAVLAAYRERKRRALATAHGHEDAPIDDPEASAGRDGGPLGEGPATSATSPPPPGTPRPTASSSPSPSLAPAATPPAPSSALEVHRPAGLSSAPGATLSPLGPTLRLSDALLKDVRVSVKGSPALRAAGILVLLLGLLLVAFDRRTVANGGATGLLLPAGAALAVAGLAANQQEEWRRVQTEARHVTTMWRVGLALAIAGLLAVVAGYALPNLAVWAFGAATAAVGLALLAIAQVRRGLARRLYVQTMVLSGLEAAGLGGPDGRVQPVILALDGLLGALPEAEVQRFLATPQAKAYLELVDEAMRSKRGG